MTFQKVFINKKTNLLIGYLKESEEFLKFSDKEILADFGKLHIAERLLQLIVDTAIDVNEHFIKELSLPEAEDYQSTFKILASNGILPTDFAVKIAPAVGLRNRIVHGYEEVDKQIFINDFRNDIDDFGTYLGFINKYLDKLT